VVVEPKKRGRRPKKAQAQQKSEEKVVEEDEEDQEDAVPARVALAEKSGNTPKPNGKARKTPSFSPITSAEPEDRPQPKAADLLSKDKENVPPSTPAKPKTVAPPSSKDKGPTRNSPINPPSLGSSGRKTLYRVGLSRRQHIPSLLRKVQRDKTPPKIVVKQNKETKGMLKAYAEYEGEDGEHKDPGEMRGADGMLVEWEF